MNEIREIVRHEWTRSFPEQTIVRCLHCAQVGIKRSDGKVTGPYRPCRRRKVLLVDLVMEALS